MQVRVIALGSTADLLKDDRAKQAAIAEERFIPTLLQALQVMKPHSWGKRVVTSSLVMCIQ